MQNIKYCKLAWDFCDLKGMCSLYSNGPNFLEGRWRYLCLQYPQYWAPNCPSCFTNKAILSAYNSIGNEHCYHDYFIDKRTWERSQEFKQSTTSPLLKKHTVRILEIDFFLSYGHKKFSEI